mmetsp:Transcript_27448/g.44058  ORF Transcript_27448/g.44058 Transcript_27448/m.44058 type:complete len:391 (-) Transcript_27448:88-1260(-)
MESTRVSSPRRVDNATPPSVEPSTSSTLRERAELAQANEEKMQPLLAVLDLDGTIVHAHQEWGKPYDFEIGDCSNRLYVHARPGTSSFLEWLRQSKIQVAVYTAGTAEYASGVVKNLDPRGNLVQQSLSREDCVADPSRPNAFTKDLTKFRDDMRRIVLVDNSSMSFTLQPDNGILVQDWLGLENNDMELVRVRSILEKLVNASDVREVLRQEPQTQGSQSPRKFKPCAGCGVAMPRGCHPGAAVGNPTGRWFCTRCWSAWGWPWLVTSSPESWWANQSYWTSHLQSPYVNAWRDAAGNPYRMHQQWSMARNLPEASSMTGATGEWKSCGPPWKWQSESHPQPSSMTGELPSEWPRLRQAVSGRTEDAQNSSEDALQQFTSSFAAATAGA